MTRIAQRVNIRKYGEAMALGALTASIRDMVPFTAARALRTIQATPAHQPAACRPPQVAFSRPPCQSTWYRQTVYRYSYVFICTLFSWQINFTGCSQFRCFTIQWTNLGTKNIRSIILGTICCQSFNYSQMS